MAQFDVTAVFKVTGLAELNASFRSISSSAADVGRSLQKVGQATTRFARNVGIAGAATAGIVGNSVKEFIEFEDAVIAAQKTTDLAGDDLERLKDVIGDLSVELASSQSDLLEITAAAGRLGVEGVDNLTKFTEVIQKFNVASDDIQGEEAATALARIIDVTRGNIDDVDRFASQIVRLGNEFATTEGEVTNTALEIAKATNAFGVATEETIGLAGAFSQFGISPEIARSSLIEFNKVLQSSLRDGGDQLENFTGLVGRTEQEIRDALEAGDFAELFVDFLGGTAIVSQEQGVVALNNRFNDLGITSKRILPAIQTLGVNIDKTREVIDTAADEFERNTALTTEFGLRTGALSFILEQARVGFENLNVAAGGQLAPSLAQLSGVFADLVSTVRPAIEEVFGELNTKIAEFATRLAETIANDPGAIADRVLGFFRAVGQFFGAVASAFNVLKNDIFPPLLAFLDRIGAIFGISGGQLGLILLVGQLSGAFGVLTSVIGLVVSVGGLLSTVFTGLVTVFGLLSTPVLIVIGVIAALAAGIAFVIDKTIGFEEAWRRVKDFFTETLIPAILKVSEVLFEVFVTGLEFILEKAIQFGKFLVAALIPDRATLQAGIDAAFRLFEVFGEKLITFFTTTVPAALSTAFRALGSSLSSLFSSIFSGVTNAFNAVIRTITSGVERVRSLISSIRSAASSVTSAVSNTASRVRAGVGSAVGRLNLSNLQGFAGGGRVSGPGSSTSDSILAKLSNGEFVINAASVSRFGTGLFEMLNRGIFPSLQGFADGGLVSAINSSTSRVNAKTRIPSLNPTAGSPARTGRPLNLILPSGEVIKATTSEDTATKLQKNLRRADNVKASALPEWY